MKALAKINLTLDVLGKRGDGYHDIDSVMQHISLADEVEAEEAEELSLACDVPSLRGKQNLAFQAAELLKERYSVERGARITLRKRIPVGAGLSGGSSDAAAVLRLLNGMWKLHLSLDQLAALGAELGSDIPFHLYGGTCRVMGRGEKVEKLLNFPKHHVVVVSPGFRISTKQAYSRFTSYLPVHSTERFMKKYALWYVHNDFEKVLFPLHPKLKELKELLSPHSLLSGSGSCVFGLFKEEAEAKAAFRKAKKKFKDVWLAETV